MYLPSILIKAYLTIKGEALPLHRAAIGYIVSLTTLGYCVDNKGNIECIETGSCQNLY